MSETLPSVRADFFGKDKFVPFIGIVEDVKDPKQGNRVKVRCLGWHPKDKDGEGGVKTEDLPWAKVGMPVTHAQQARVGGKHALLPGCWVFGCFLDGDEAQQPFIINSFGFTPKASDQSTRIEDKDTDGGTQSEDVDAFAKVDSNKNSPNIDNRTVKEQGGQVSDGADPDADSVLNDSVDGCEQLQSTASNRRQDKEMKNEDNSNAESQLYDVSAGDGLCGTIAHAAEDAQKKIKERIPSQAARFIYGDVVWNNFNGNYIDLNGLFLKVAIEIATLMVQPAQSQKAATEDLVNRVTKSAGLLIPDRDGVVTQESDDKTTTKDDKFHGLFATGTIDTLLTTVMQLLQNANNGGGGGNGGNNAGGEIGVNPDTTIANNEAQCLTEDLVVNIIAEIDDSIERAQRDSEEGGAGDILGNIFGILGSLSNVMNFALVQKNAVQTQIFNRSGPMSQDANTKNRGCLPNRRYNTNIGFQMAGFGGGAGGGGGGGGGSVDNPTNPGNPAWENTGFGGIPKDTPIVPTDGTPCEDATTPTQPDDGTLPPLGAGGGNVADGVGDTLGGAGDGTLDGGGPGFGGGFGGGPGDGNPGVNPNDGTVTGGGGTGDTNQTGGGTNGTGTGGNLPGGGGTTTGGGDGTGVPPYTIVTNPDGSSTITTPGNVIQIPAGQPIPDFEGVGIPTPVSPTNLVPGGKGGIVVGMPLPSDEPACAKNFKAGVPNVVVVLNKGNRYYYNNPINDGDVFPSVYIPSYNGRPIPVVDKDSGELFAILTTCESWNTETPSPPITIIPDDSPIGITTDQTDEYDFVLGGFVIINTGFDYTDPVIKIIDRDTLEENGEATLTTLDGRIVDVELINNGSGFNRIPSVSVIDGVNLGRDTQSTGGAIIGADGNVISSDGDGNPGVNPNNGTVTGAGGTGDTNQTGGESGADRIDGTVGSDGSTPFINADGTPVTRKFTQGGYGAKIYPIMSVIPRDTAKPKPDIVQSIYCPAKNQQNLI